MDQGLWQQEVEVFAEMYVGVCVRYGLETILLLAKMCYQIKRYFGFKRLYL